MHCWLGFRQRCHTPSRAGGWSCSHRPDKGWYGLHGRPPICQVTAALSRCAMGCSVGAAPPAPHLVLGGGGGGGGGGRGRGAPARPIPGTGREGPAPAGGGRDGGRGGARLWPMLHDSGEGMPPGGGGSERAGAASAGPATPPEREAPGAPGAEGAPGGAAAGAGAPGPPVLDRKSIRAQLSVAWQAAARASPRVSPRGPLPAAPAHPAGAGPSGGEAAGPAADPASELEGAAGAAADPASALDSVAGATADPARASAGAAGAEAARPSPRADSAATGAEGRDGGAAPPPRHPQPEVPQSLPKMAAKTWWLRPEDVQFDTHPDGSRVLLGEGSFGRVRRGRLPAPCPMRHAPGCRGGTAERRGVRDVHRGQRAGRGFGLWGK